MWFEEHQKYNAIIVQVLAWLSDINSSFLSENFASLMLKSYLTDTDVELFAKWE